MADINKYSPQSGRVIGEDNQIYNIVDLLKDVGGSNMNPEDYYTKAESDANFQSKGDYATTDQIPTSNSELTNDSGYITSADLPSVPTNNNQLTNGAGYITNAYDNTTSGLTATDIQAAIDELKAMIDGLGGA